MSKVIDSVENKALPNFITNRFNFNGNVALNTFRPVYNIIWPFVRNPNFRNGLVPQFDSCDANDGNSGVCMGSAACIQYGGKATGSCSIGGVCCVGNYMKFTKPSSSRGKHDDF